MANHTKVQKCWHECHNRLRAAPPCPVRNMRSASSPAPRGAPGGFPCFVALLVAVAFLGSLGLAAAQDSAAAAAAPRGTAAPAILRAAPRSVAVRGRGVHSFTSQLNLSALYGIGGARRGCVARVKGVLGGVYGVKGVSVCQARLKLS